MSAKSIGREVAVCALGFVLMVVAHAFGLLGYGMAQGNSWHMPYWGSYLILYPAAAAFVMRVSAAGWLQTSACLVAPPVVYFAALGLLDGNWRASDGALGGALVAFAVTAIVARLTAARREVATAHARDAA